MLTEIRAVPDGIDITQDEWVAEVRNLRMAHSKLEGNPALVAAVMTARATGLEVDWEVVNKLADHLNWPIDGEYERQT